MNKSELKHLIKESMIQMGIVGLRPINLREDETQSGSEIRDVINIVSKFIKDGYSTYAKLTIAKYFKLKKYVVIFNAINSIINAEGYMPETIVDYEDELTKKMLKLLQETIDPKIYYKIEAAL